MVTPELLSALAVPLVDHRPVITELKHSTLNSQLSTAFSNDTTREQLPVTDALVPLLRSARFTADLIVAAAEPANAAEVFHTALEFASPWAEGVLLVNGHYLPTPLQQQHLWAAIEVDGVTALYFAASVQNPRTSYTGCASPAHPLAEMTADLKRARLHVRRGLQINPLFAITKDTVAVWHAAEAELKRGQTRHWHVAFAQPLNPQPAVLTTQTTPFDRCVLPASDLDTLLAFNGQTLAYVVSHRPSRRLLARLIEQGRVHPDVAAAYPEEMRRAVNQLQELRAGIPQTDLPVGLCAELRPYQKDGFDWLAHLARADRGGILADDMGLGKTLQTLAWLLWLKQRDVASTPSRPSLVVCPASVMDNWRAEAAKFTPDLKVVVLSGSSVNRKSQIENRKSTDLIITNYALLRRDLTRLAKVAWSAVILDEAQFIKNPTAKITHAVKALRARHRLALTGTPLENKLLDVWSIVDFVAPGHLGPADEFCDRSAVAVRKDLRPLLLRRLKGDVAKDLPDRRELRRDCALGAAQMAFYQQELARSRKEVFETVADKGLQHSRIHILAALTRLRQICCHPALIGSREASGKLAAFFELLGTLGGRKVLVFSQFTRMLELLQTECHQRGLTTYFLTGDTPVADRKDIVAAFNAWQGGTGDPPVLAGDPPGSGRDGHALSGGSPKRTGGSPVPPTVFLLSLRAAGTGLNLTTASEVVLYDPWWNPAVEAQAIDRSHRIGQRNCVTAHRLISRGTIEERIWDIQQEKGRTIDAVLGESGFTRNLTKSDLEYLFGDSEENIQQPTSNNQHPVADSDSPAVYSPDIEFRIPLLPSTLSPQLSTAFPSILASSGFEDLPLWRAGAQAARLR